MRHQIFTLLLRNIVRNVLWGTRMGWRLIGLGILILRISVLYVYILYSVHWGSLANFRSCQNYRLSLMPVETWHNFKKLTTVIFPSILWNMWITWTKVIIFQSPGLLHHTSLRMLLEFIEWALTMPRVFPPYLMASKSIVILLASSFGSITSLHRQLLYTTT